MVTIADAQVDLFGSELPGLEDLTKLSLYVNSSELNRIDFGEKVEANSKNKLAVGIGLFILGQTEDAFAKLQKSPDCKEKYMYLGYACRAMKDYEAALKNFAKAGKHNADSLVVSLEKAATYRQCGRLEEASDELSGCANFENVSADYHCQLGKLEDAKGDYADGMANYSKAIELDARHCEALFSLAYSCDLRGDEDAAIDYYRQVIKTAPAHVNALLNLAVVYEDRCEYDKASTCVESVLMAHPNHAKAILFDKDIESSKVMIYDEEREKRRDRHNKILEIPISDFELSVRSRNCLKKMDIYTLGDLLRITEAELLSYKNFGETSLVEIKKILDSKGLTLGMALEDQDISAVSEAAGQGASEDILNKSVDELELSVRARRALSRLGLNTLLEVVSKTEAELLGCKNFGVTSLNEIKDRLVSYGLSLRKLE